MFNPKPVRRKCLSYALYLLWCSCYKMGVHVQDKTLPSCLLQFRSSGSAHSLLIVTPNVGFFNWSMFCCALLCVHSTFAIILIGKRELVALLSFPSWCIMIVMWLFLAMPQVCLQFVIVLFPDHTHLLFFCHHK